MKDSFLGNVAKSLYGRYGDGVSSLNIVMPNRRSRLFLEEALADEAGKPLWQPHYSSIDDLMGDIAGMRPADRIRSVVELYKVWIEYHEEPFDRFYFWGETLLADFDQIDKYLVDAAALFRNLSDLKNIGDDFEYFNEEQRGAVARFWSAFATESGVSAEKERFHAIWNSLGAVYRRFRENLASQGVGYVGMTHRAAAERIASGQASVKSGARYAVVGFNALSECEKVLFDHLKAEYGAEFFWDYDDYYTHGEGQEAGLFAKRNTARYPQPEYFLNPTDNFGKRKNITAVSLPSDSLQCKYAATFIREVARRQGGVGKETAIVLTNEQLLVPLLHSLPEEVNDVNITMGYPLRQSLAYSFTERLFRLQNNAREKGGEAMFHYSDVTGLLSHPFVLSGEKECADAIRTDMVLKSKVFVRGSEFAGSPFLEKVFSRQTSWRGLTDYIIDILSIISGSGAAAGCTPYETVLQREFFGEIAETLRKLGGSLADCDVEITSATFASLARRMLQNIRIPYSGEPLKGLQIMGILETRNLDFDNVLILSMNDDTFPGNPSASASFIPYNLRFGYGLPTPQYHDGVYAYYFYRLLQRAGDVCFTYSSTTGEDSSGEPSRYIYQLEYESPHEVGRENASLDISLAGYEPITVNKTPEVMAIMSAWLDVDCPPSPMEHGGDCGNRSRLAGSAGNCRNSQLPAESGRDYDAASPPPELNNDCEDSSPPAKSVGDCGKRSPLERPAVDCGASLPPPGGRLEYLSPSALNTYLDCPLKFYFLYVAKLRPEEEVTEEIDVARFGDILHRAMELLYTPLKGVADPRPAIKELIGSPQAGAMVDRAVSDVCFGGEAFSPDEIAGNLLLVGEIVGRYINRSILPFDARREPFTILELERRLGCGFGFRTGGMELTVRLGGKADRVDALDDGGVRIVDYKTGSIHKDFVSVGALTGDDPKKRAPAVFQTFLYSLMVDTMQKSGELTGRYVCPELYYVRAMNAEDYSPLLDHDKVGVVEDYSPYREELEEVLRRKLEEIFDPSQPFAQCADASPCSYCDFAAVCRRSG